MAHVFTRTRVTPILYYDLHTVRHQYEYRSDAGITNNQAESYFSRFKRMYYGQVHKMSNVYLLGYANEIAYREDNRRKSNGWQFCDVLGKCLTTRTIQNGAVIGSENISPLKGYYTDET